MAPYSPTSPTGLAALNAEVTWQAQMIAYIDDFHLTGADAQRGANAENKASTIEIPTLPPRLPIRLKIPDPCMEMHQSSARTVSPRGLGRFSRRIVQA